MSPLTSVLSFKLKYIRYLEPYAGKLPKEPIFVDHKSCVPDTYPFL